MRNEKRQGAQLQYVYVCKVKENRNVDHVLLPHGAVYIGLRGNITGERPVYVHLYNRYISIREAFK